MELLNIPVKMKITKDKDGLSLMNMQITPCGGISRCGWKTLRGFIKILKQQNRLLIKHNTRVKFEIVLPLPE